MLTIPQLNDIISLAVGLWAVKAAQRSSTDKYSFGVSLVLTFQENNSFLTYNSICEQKSSVLALMPCFSLLFVSLL